MIKMGRGLGFAKTEGCFGNSQRDIAFNCGTCKTNIKTESHVKLIYKLHWKTCKHCREEWKGNYKEFVFNYEKLADDFLVNLLTGEKVLACEHEKVRKFD